MGTFLPMFVAIHLLLGSLDWASKQCKRQVGVTFEMQRGLYWAYPYSDRFFGAQMYKVSTLCYHGHSLTANLIPDSSGLVDILQ